MSLHKADRENRRSGDGEKHQSFIHPVPPSPRRPVWFLLSALCFLLCPNAHAAILLQSGWEDGPLGCSDAALSDNGKWEGYNVGTYCVSPPKIEVVQTGVHSGSHAITKHQYRGDIGDGGGFETVLYRHFVSPLPEWYLRYYVKYGTGYYWHSDMKEIITGDTGQNIYINNRPYYTCAGVGPDHHAGRLAIHLVSTDTLLESANVRLVPGNWYLIEAHFRASSNPSTANGVFEAKVNGVPVEWCQGPLGGIRTEAPRFSYFKWSTYTNGSNDPAFQAAMPFEFSWDDLQVCDTTWCGPVGGTPPPPNACDLNGNGVSVTDVQLCSNQAISVAACLPAGQSGSGDINSDNQCNVIDVQRVVNAALGGQCVTQ